MIAPVLFYLHLVTPEKWSPACPCPGGCDSAVCSHTQGLLTQRPLGNTKYRPAVLGLRKVLNEELGLAFVFPSILTSSVALLGEPCSFSKSC